MAIWPCLNLVHWERWCKGLKFDPIVIPSVWLPFFCLFVSSFFAASSVRVICPFQGFLGLIFTLPDGTLSLEEMSWLLFSGNVLPIQHFQWMTFLFSSVVSLKLSAALSQFHQNYYYNFKLSDVHKSSTVLMLLACWGLNRNIPCCWHGVSHCPVLSFCSCSLRQEAVGIWGLVLASCVQRLAQWGCRTGTSEPLGNTNRRASVSCYRKRNEVIL